MKIYSPLITGSISVNNVNVTNVTNVAGFASTGSNQFNGNQSITGSLLVNGGALAVQDGTILYYTSSWFTPSSTVSTSGTTVTSVGTQFTSAMVGAKLTISGESRIITTYTSTTQVTVNSSYSQNYSGVASGNWGVFSRAFSMVDGTSTNIIYDSTGNIKSRFDSNGNYVNTSLYNVFNNNLSAGTFLSFGTAAGIRFSPANNDGLVDVRLRRINTGSLQIDNGSSDTAYRDLLLRNITGSNATFSGSVIVNGTITAQTLVVQTVTSSVEFVTGSTRNGSLSSNTHEFTGSVLVSGSVGIGTTSPGTLLHVSGSSSIIIPVGTTAQRNAVPSSGMIRINSTFNKLEFFNNSTWNVVKNEPVGTYSDPITDIQAFDQLSKPEGNYYFRPPNNTSSGSIIQMYYKVMAGNGFVRVFSSPYNDTATVNLINLNIPLTQLLVQRSDEAFQTTAGWNDGALRYFNTRNTTGDLTTTGDRIGSRIYFGYAGGHGIYNTTQNVCSWSSVGTGAVGAGYDGATCGSFPDGLRWGTSTSTSNYDNRSGTWELWLRW